LTLAPADGRDDPAGYPGTIRDVVCLGAVDEVLVTVDNGPELTAQTTAGDHPELGARCLVSVPPASVIVWPDRVPPAPPAEPPRRPRRTSSFTMPDMYDVPSARPG
ncbi:MAG: TOBE domain-containing protein, partial [Pseudonocardiaceae bacterium]